MKGNSGRRMLSLATFKKWCLATPYKKDRDLSRRNARAREKALVRRIVKQEADGG